MDFIGFDELIIIVVIALLVLGPAKTFKLMFSIGQFFAKAKNYLNSVKTQLQLDEIRNEVSSIRENDFHDVVNRVPPVTTNRSPQNGKRQWTVTDDDFKEKEVKSSGRDLWEKEQKSSLEKNSDNSEIFKRIENLEQEVAALKEKIAR